MYTDVKFRKKAAGILYDTGCDTIAKLRLKKYNDTLKPGSRRCLKYIEFLGSPVQRESAETIVVCCCSLHAPQPQAQDDRRTQEFCKDFMSMDKYEIVITGD
jgi:hypothetical protein